MILLVSNQTLDTYDHQFKPWTLSFWCGGLIFEFDWGFKLICFQKWVFDLKLKFGVWFETKETIFWICNSFKPHDIIYNF